MRLLIASLTVVVANSVHAQLFEIIPPNPRYMESVTLRYTTVGIAPKAALYGATVAKRADLGDAIVVTVYSHPTDADVTRDVSLGQFPTGRYNVLVQDAQAIGGFTATVFDVGPAPVPGLPAQGGAAIPAVNYSGQWWTPDTPGWGLAITQGPTNKVYAEWLTYDETGQPTWLALGPGEWTRVEPSAVYTAPVRRTTVNSVNQYPKAPPVTVEVGVGTLSFDDHLNGTLTLILSNGTAITKKIARLPIE